jgi:hypothetical protein
MKLPQGRLVRERVVTDLGTVLSTALDAELTGYARLEAQDALLLDAEGVGVLTFERGVPTVAYHTGTDDGGASALADIAVAGPYRLELYELDAETLGTVHDTESLRVSPELPAERLAGNHDLAERTLAATPNDRGRDNTKNSEAAGAVEAFLDDEETIMAIQSRAREQAEERAEEWDFRR